MGARVIGRSADRPVMSRSLGGEDVDHAPREERVVVTYTCGAGHELGVPFHKAATPPPTWNCPCGREGAVETAYATAVAAEPTEHRRGGADPLGHVPVREGAWYTNHHRKCLLERRTVAELEALLQERLESRRAGATAA